MLTAVAWANRRLDEIGLRTHAIVYSFGAARLISMSGRELASVADWDGAFACWLLVARLESDLANLLYP